VRTAIMKNLTKEVEYILENYPESRNSDQYLTLKLWAHFYKSRIQVDFRGKYVYLKDIMDLPREDNVKRIRAKIQNEEQRLLPTSLEVVKKRRQNEKIWRNYIIKNK